MELKIYIRHTQFLAFEKDVTNGLAVGDPIVFTGLNTSLLKPIKGTVPIKEWIDVTNSVGNIDKLTLTWTSELDDNGNLTSDKFNKIKSASGTLQFEDQAYFIVKAWLQDHIAAPLNAIDVKIEHVGCGVYTELIIKPTQITWCEDGNCLYDVTLQQKDPSYHCIQKTLIDDDWQGWFNKHTTKQHPRFLYCNEGRPIYLMLSLWYISTLLFIFILTLTPVINSIIAIIGVIKTIINAFKWLFGKKVDWSSAFNFFDPRDIMGSFYAESSGCGFNHPAPLIRDYITNVCDKCGVKVDDYSAPVFFSRRLSLDTSAERELGIVRRINPYYFATYLAPTIRRGFRRYKNLFGKDKNPIYYWNTENAPLLALSDFLDEIKGAFNSEWRIQNNAIGEPTLYFWRKDWFTNGQVLYDFTKDDDRMNILKGMCFNWNENTLPTYIHGLYGDDANDVCGNSAKKFMNDYVSVASKTNNTLFSGEMNKIQKLGATKFRQDGVSEDYLMDAIQQLLNAAVSAPLLIDTIVREVVVPIIKTFDYALLLSDDTNSLGKIIIWDESSGFEDSFSIRNVGAKDLSRPIQYKMPPPIPNPHYNPTSQTFDQLNEIQTWVKGNGLTINDEELGIYNCAYWFGYVLYERPAILSNYPMYFSSKFKDNLYDWFHWIDDPNIKPRLNMNWDVTIELCCEQLKKLGVFDGASRLQLLERVKVPNKYYSDGVLTEITVSYDSEDELGKFIKLKGTV